MKNISGLLDKTVIWEVSMSEVVKALAAIKGQQGFYNYDSEKIDKEGIVLINRYANTVVQALEKQIQKKTYKVHIAGKDIYYCGSCDMVSGDGFYCRHCGQKLDCTEERGV